ncbi:hypothetical protein [Amycolatopsis sp. BJA-103]|uniref:hypothetical protein n=1 Tax=Amycolatopsis sp. BJA-103 TaxID=1911175 RepID=UPI0011AF7E07|nr:hypothetical protein [Amycolatopsis sp. BJA-103]
MTDMLSGVENATDSKPLTGLSSLTTLVYHNLLTEAAPAVSESLPEATPQVSLLCWHVSTPNTRGTRHGSLG